MTQRKTVQREAILRVLRTCNTHPTADWVYDRVREMLPHVSKGTIYRNLRLLRESGEVSEIDLCGTISRFEGRCDPHYHFRCEQCGCVFDLSEPVHEDLDRKVEEQTGFSVRRHYMEFHGLCQDCRARYVEKSTNREVTQ